ncbi:MAG: cupin domain-containing protein [Candidatus Omnitrophica bacterium]|nr:cupin domain-containing protein [Candidatus Omnitrophota bacterium]
MFLKKFAEKGFRKKRKGVYGKIIAGKNAQLVWCMLDPGYDNSHIHNHEQIGYILKGRIKVTIAGRSKILEPGDAYYIPAGVRHGFKVIGNKKAGYFEVFSPPKKENMVLLR